MCKMSDLSDFIKSKRISSGMTIREMAKRLGIAHGYWSNIENGLRPVPSDVLTKLATIFDLPEKEELHMYVLETKAKGYNVAPYDLLEYLTPHWGTLREDDHYR